MRAQNRQGLRRPKGQTIRNNRRKDKGTYDYTEGKSGFMCTGYRDQESEREYSRRDCGGTSRSGGWGDGLDGKSGRTDRLLLIQETGWRKWAGLQCDKRDNSLPWR